MGMAAILVTWPETFENTFVPLTHKRLTWNLASMLPEALKMFERINQTNLGQRSNNDLDLGYSYVFMYLVKDMYQLSVD